MRKTLLVICGIACVTGLHAQDVERTQDKSQEFYPHPKRYGRNTFLLRRHRTCHQVSFPSPPGQKKLSRHQNPGRRKPVLHGTRRQSVHKDGEYGSRHGQEFGKNHFQGCPRQFISAGKRIRHKLHSVQRRAV